MKNLLPKICLILVFAILAGCTTTPSATSNPTGATAAATPAKAGATAYPVPGAASQPTAVQTTPGLSNVSTAYPGVMPQATSAGTAYPAAPTETLTKNIEVPKPKNDSGVVIGYLKTQGDNKPYRGILYLGGMIYADNPAAPPMVGFSVETNPKAEMDQTGRFLFKDVKPGDYGLVLWSPVSFFLLNENNTEKSLKVVVKKGEVTDLGIVYIK